MNERQQTGYLKQIYSNLFCILFGPYILTFRSTFQNLTEFLHFYEDSILSMDLRKVKE